MKPVSYTHLFRSFAVNWDREDGTYARHPEDVVSRPADNFARHNAIAAFFGPGFGLDVTDGDRVMYEVWNRASDLLLESDFYALTEYSKSPESFYSIQFDCPEKGKGCLLYTSIPRRAQGKSPREGTTRGLFVQSRIRIYPTAAGRRAR